MLLSWVVLPFFIPIWNHCIYITVPMHAYIYVAFEEFQFSVNNFISNLKVYFLTNLHVYLLGCFPGRKSIKMTHVFGMVSLKWSATTLLTWRRMGLIWGTARALFIPL